MEDKATLYLIDGSAIAYRSYFAMLRNRLTTSKGQPTGAIYAFVNSLIKIINEEKPDYIGIVFDAPEKTFRHKIYEEYKATREAMPEELVSQLPLMFKIIEAMNIPVVIKPGYEADDIIGTLAKKADEKGLKVFIVAGDKDFMQLLNDNIYLYKTSSSKKDIEVLNKKDVEEKLGIAPEQVTDYLGLIGDTSDNIPGIKGIGPAKAVPLLKKWGSLEKIIENTNGIENDKIAKMIKEEGEKAFLSKLLATIKTNVPIDIKLENLKSKKVNEKALIKLFEELEFFTLIKLFRGDAAEEKPKRNYKSLSTLNEVQELVTTLKNIELLSVDLETTSTRPMEAEIVGISISWEPNSGVYIPVRCLPEENNEKGSDIGMKLLSELKPIMEDESILKCGHNLKYDVLILKRNGIILRGVEFDTMIAAFLIQPDAHSYKLDNLSQQYLHYTMQPIEDLIGKKGKNQLTMDTVELDKITFYAVEDADVALKLVPIFEKKLKSDGTWDTFKNIEMPLIPVLVKMEENGVYLDTGYLKQMSNDLSKKIDALTQEIYNIVGEKFNINSPSQLSEILFEKLNLPKVRGKSTDVKVLESLEDKHPLPKRVLEYRGLVKLKSTYLDTLPLLVNKKTGRIHSSFNQTGASTGRLSSSDPNFQNIPIRTDIGREIRNAFVPQKSGWAILSADYSQIELRIMAHLSKDPELIKAFKEGADVHTRTAALVYGVSEKDVLPEMRRIAKVVNFGIMYGAGPYRMSQELGIPRHEAESLIDQYFRTYPGINDYIIKTLDAARKNGFVKTLSGRLRYVTDINSSNKNVREAAERVAINMPIQGTAADMIKIAMIRIHNEIANKKLNSMMLLQIHDELLFEIPEDEINYLRPMIKEKMENALKLDIPIKVDIGIGKSWYEAH
jgi:DNA polymerase-1